MNQKIVWVSLLIIALFIQGCSHCKGLFCTKKAEQPKAQTAVVNPNGDSELAILMRRMTDDLEAAKQQLIKGKKARIQGDYKDILTAKPTSPHMKNEAFDGFAQSLLYQMNRFSAFGDVKSYNDVVHACIACHNQSCPGPIARIKKLMIYL